MADKQIIPPKHDLDAKWDACLDLTVRRFVYSSSAGAFAGAFAGSASVAYSVSGNRSAAAYLKGMSRV
ncbi:unnamed protein product [Sphenostylis stenocarpa]|uniref:Uncharacterized protein n=1 Tax=Sphenostylis stenocarpa TaxID=92480 RepID=A0AA86SGN8_9FABA|nr:unnamed protein product [Sphenostylis stenocarpa]